MLKLQQDPILIAGPVGQLETLVIAPKDGAPRGIAMIAHPNPLQGGTNTNKVVQTTARALSQHGYVCYCPNLRGVGNSGGAHDYGHGEVDDAQAVVDYARAQHGDLPLVLAGLTSLAGLAGGAAVLAGAWWLEGRLHTSWLLRIFSFAHAWAIDRVPGLSSRLDGAARRIADRLQDPAIDEVLVVSRASGFIRGSSDW